MLLALASMPPLGDMQRALSALLQTGEPVHRPAQVRSPVCTGHCRGLDMQRWIYTVVLPEALQS